MSIKVRKAGADDIELVAWAVMESSRSGKGVGLFDLIFQPSDDTALLAALTGLVNTSVKSYCHYSNFLIAEAGGKAVALLCSYEPRIATRDSFARALLEVGIDESFEERIAGYLLCVPEIDRQTWMLDFIIETPGHESFETLKELVQKSLLTARLKGYRKAQTMLEIGSLKEQMLYEKLGFKFENEKRSEYYKELFGRAGIMRYSILL